MDIKRILHMDFSEKDIKQMPLEELVEACIATKEKKKRADELYKVTKERLFEFCDRLGKRDDGGQLVLKVGQHIIMEQHRVTVQYDLEKVETVLERNKLYSHGSSVDMKKVHNLVKAKLIFQDEIAGCSVGEKVVLALTIEDVKL